MSGHFLVVTSDEGADGYPEWWIEHPAECPTVEVYEDTVDYGCHVASEIAFGGLAGAFGSWAGWPEDVPRIPGRYPIEYWNESYYNHYAGGWEHDAGLRLVAQEMP